MLHVLKFTRYSEMQDLGNIDNSGCSDHIELVLNAEFEGEELIATSPLIHQSKALDSVLDRELGLLVEDIVNQALKVAVSRKLLNINLGGMSTMDKMSLLNIRQTVGFTNDLYKSCRNVSVVLMGIW